MNIVLKIFLLFLPFTSLYADIAVTPTYIPRSQSCYKLRTLIGSLEYTDLCRATASRECADSCKTSTKSFECIDSCAWYGNLSITGVYMQSFDDSKIGKSIFGTDLSCGPCDNSILVQGSQVSNRSSNAWLADYLYLNCNFDGSFHFKPRIQNVLLDFDFYLGLDEMLAGAYLRAYGPITWTRWQTNFYTTTISGALTTSCSIGYLTPDGSETLLTSIGQYFCGEVPVSNASITFDPLRFGKMRSGAETKWGFADLRIELGYNFVRKENTHIGVNLQMAVPTGNKRRAEFVFNPVVGNGHHWEFGGGLTAHYVFYCNVTNQLKIEWFTDLNITHVFRGIEERTFDLVGKPNSRYILAAKFSDQIQNNLSGSNLPNTSAPTLTNVTNPSAQFANEYTPVANLTTIGIKVKNTIQVDWVTLFNFKYKNYSIDLGYNLWIRTCEGFLSNPHSNDLCSFGVQPTLFDESQMNTWALKGDANMFGYATLNAGGLTVGQAVALSASQDNATIHSGTNVSAGGTLTNLGVDNARFAYAGTNDQQLNFAPGLAANASSQISTSINPIFINLEDIALQPVRGLSNTLFAHFSYNWEHNKYFPYIGIGGSVEFGQNKTHHLTQPDSVDSFIDTLSTRCITASVSQWALWIKGGFAFQ